MEISIKVNSQDYQRLRRQMPANSPAREAINKASRIEHALEGIQFEGYATRNSYLRKPRISFFTANRVPEKKMVLVEFISHKQRLLDNDTPSEKSRVSFGTIFCFCRQNITQN